jgi:hypothetical protein
VVYTLLGGGWNGIADHGIVQFAPSRDAIVSKENGVLIAYVTGQGGSLPR